MAELNNIKFLSEVTFEDAVNITGNLTVTGNTVVENKQDILVKDATIVVNADGTSVNVSKIGTVYRTNNEDAYGIVYNASEDSIQLGQGKYNNETGFAFNSGAAQSIATRQDMPDNSIPKWDGEKYTLKDSGIYIGDDGLQTEGEIYLKTRKPGSGLEFFYNEADNAYELIGRGTCADIDLVVPSIYKGLPVYKIQGTLFDNYIDLTSLTFPDTIQEININRLERCPNLQAINVIGTESQSTKNYSSIDGNLYNISGTTLLKYAPGKTETDFVVPNFTDTIGARAFEGSSNLRNLDINNVQQIEELAFILMKKLENINLRNVVHLDSGLFIETNIKELYFPSTIECFPEQTLVNISGLERISLSIPSNQQDFSFGKLFLTKDSFGENYVIPNTLNEVIIREGEIPSRTFVNLKTTEGYTLTENYSIQKLEICDGVTKMNSGALQNMKAKSITIPFLGENESTVQPLYWLYGADTADEANGFIPFDLEEVIITKSPSSVYADLLVGTEYIKHLSLSYDTKSIGEGAFQYCTGLEKLTLPACDWGIKQ